MRAGLLPGLTAAFVVTAAYFPASAQSAASQKHSATQPSGLRNCESFRAAHPNYHIAGGPNDTTCFFEDPPKNFNQFAASDKELEQWGLPPHPVKHEMESNLNYKFRMKTWETITRSAIENGRNRNTYVCTSKRSDFAGPEEAWKACLIPATKVIRLPPRAANTPVRGGSQQSSSSAPPPINKRYLSTAAQAGYILTFANQPPIGGGLPGADNAAVFFNVTGSTALVQFLTPNKQCATHTQPQMTASSWIGLQDNEGGLLDQAGGISTFTCATKSYTTYVFAEEPLHDGSVGQRIITTCDSSVGPGSNVSSSIYAIEYGFGGYSVNASSGTCSLGAVTIGGVDDPYQAHGQGVIAAAEFYPQPSMYIPNPAVATVMLGVSVGGGVPDQDKEYDFSFNINSNPAPVNGLALILYYLTAPLSPTIYQPSNYVAPPTQQISYSAP
jgi:hypothetical protein